MLQERHWLLCFALFGVVVVLYASSRLTAKRRRYPPGPPQRWYSGNLHQLPNGPGGRKYAQWAKTYGDIIHMRVFSEHVIVLNSERAARALLEGRATIYSDRPQPTMYAELMGRKHTIFAQRYDESFKRYTRMLQRAINKKAVQDYWHYQEDASNRFLRSLMTSPDRFEDHIRTCGGRIIMKVAYGYDIAEEDDYYVGLVQEAISLGNQALVKGRWLVDSFPILRHVPPWFPGAGFRRFGSEARERLTAMTRAPHDMVKKQMVDGTAIPSFTTKGLLDDNGQSVSAQDEETVLWVAAGMYVGGADTIVAVLSTFFLTMMLFPDAQRKAQSDIDRVIGPLRLPAMKDRDSLVYVDALIKEVLRYNPIGPMALAHQLREDDEFEGYYLPKGSTVYPNIWAMTRNEAVYPLPDIFSPERFVPDKEGRVQRDPRDLAFGIGRRRCPGQHLAEATLFIVIAKVLATFDILPPVDAKGHEVLPRPEWSSGPNCRPLPFQCRITPRSKNTASLVDNALQA